jgi:hypothetical protein
MNHKQIESIQHELTRVRRVKVFGGLACCQSKAHVTCNLLHGCKVKRLTVGGNRWGFLSSQNAETARFASSTTRLSLLLWTNEDRRQTHP